MNKIASRLLIFFVGIPAVIFIVWLKPLNHLAFHVLAMCVSLLASMELYDIFSKKIALLPKALIVTESTLVPFVAALWAVLPAVTGKALPFGSEIITYSFIVLFLILLCVEVFSAESFEKSIERLSGSTLILLYTGYLVTFVSRFTVMERNGENVALEYIATFLLMVFLCDSFAWLLGVLFGEKNRGIFKASPKKSVMGLVGGFLGSVGAGFACSWLWKESFPGSPLKLAAVGFAIAITSVVGDLAESVFKRSADVKDSGNIILGRGGVLDSVDSILMSAPFYYILISLLY